MKNCRRLKLNTDIVHIPHSYPQPKSVFLSIFFALTAKKILEDLRRSPVTPLPKAGSV